MMQYTDSYLAESNQSLCDRKDYYGKPAQNYPLTNFTKKPVMCKKFWHIVVFFFTKIWEIVGYNYVGIVQIYSATFFRFSV